jgi:hypothetical protein
MHGTVAFAIVSALTTAGKGDMLSRGLDRDDATRARPVVWVLPDVSVSIDESAIQIEPAPAVDPSRVDFERRARLPVRAAFWSRILHVGREL